jgi:hypothetical protein
MGSFERLVAAMDERAIAQNVGILHDEARGQYALRSNTVGSFGEFTDIIADYYNYHYTQCVVRGGYMARTEAAGRAKEILVQEYKRQGENINSAYQDAHDGTNGGLRIILDRIAEHLKEESVERYLRDVFDRYVEPPSWEQKVDIIGQLFSRYGHLLPSYIRTNQPERYAQNYEEIIRGYVEALKKNSSIFRRL